MSGDPKHTAVKGRLSHGHG